MTASRSSSSGNPHDVIVIGLGPVGITLASLLCHRGLRVLAVDAAQHVYDMPRAIGLDHEVMRVFQQMGVADALTDAVGEYRPSEYRTADGEVIRRFESQPPPYPLSWPPYLTFLQPSLERTLRAHGGSLESLELRFGAEASAIAKLHDNPCVKLLDKATGETRAESARFVVGCDGGNSFVRRCLGIELDDLAFDEPWLVVDILLKDGASPVLPDVNVQYCDPKRPHTFVICPQKLRRWEFMVMPGEDPADMARPATVWRLLEPWLNRDQANLWRAATYRFHALVARRWREGNVFLAGDACHMTPPFLAQGMVQGIKDAANLAWKIASVCNGASARLLDTYEVERRPHVIEVIDITKDLGRVICELDPDRVDKRNARMRAAMAAGEGVTVRQSLFPPLRGGALFEAAGPASAVGTPAPQPWVRHGGQTTRLDDLTGANFRILALHSFVVDQHNSGRASSLGVPIHRIAQVKDAAADAPVEQDGVFFNWMSTHNLQAILVRPDHVVFAGINDNDDLRRSLDVYEQWLGGNRDRPAQPALATVQL